MKSFLLRLKGTTIFDSAQIQKMTTKMSEKFMWSMFTGRLTKFELKTPPPPLEIFMDERKHVHLVANRLCKALFFQFILRNFLDFDFNTCSYGEMFTDVSPLLTYFKQICVRFVLSIQLQKH